MTNRIIITTIIAFLSLSAFAQGDMGKEYLQKANAHYSEGHYDVAVGYYLKAAEFDEVEAMFNLGYAFYNGEGIVQSFPSLQTGCGAPNAGAHSPPCRGGVGGEASTPAC